MRNKALSWWVETGKEQEQISSVFSEVYPSIVKAISTSLTCTIIEYNDFCLNKELKKEKILLMKDRVVAAT